MKVIDPNFSHALVRVTSGGIAENAELPLNYKFLCLMEITHKVQTFQFPFDAWETGYLSKCKECTEILKSVYNIS